MKKNKYIYLDLILMPIKYAPIESAFTILYTLINGLMLAYQTLATAYFINCALDIFNGRKNIHDIGLPILLIIGYIIFQNLLPAISNIINLISKNKLTLTIQSIILEKRSTLEYKHVEHSATQDLINRVCTDTTTQIKTVFDNALSCTSLLISLISILIIIMDSTLWGAVILLLVSVPFLITAQKVGIQNYSLEKNAKTIQRKYNNIAHILMDRAFVSERKLFGYSKNLQQKYNDLNDEAFTIEAKIFTRVFSNLKSGSVVTILVSGLIIAILLPSIHNGAMSIGIFIALVNGVINLLQLISWQLPSILGDNARTKEYLKDLNLFFSLSSKTDAYVMPIKEHQFVFQSIEFKNVSFKYPNTENYILHNCSFTMYSNKTYSLVGVNGAGKSTIIKLLLGLYDDYNGEILINNKDIKTYYYNTETKQSTWEKPDDLKSPAEVQVFITKTKI
ncbi:MAG: hypothetical protein ATN31_01410 [Candidatus Epulonipiscioides saccharophilum]|nr:MAG: hypothetical protein ATN31_01410 [Epulopiscium sp. AS2M-Bin001]